MCDDARGSGRRCTVPRAACGMAGGRGEFTGGGDRRLLQLLGVAARGPERLARRPGVASLVAFAWLLTRVETAAAGRAYAGYGGVCIAASLVWLWAVGGVRPDAWDVAGVMLCLLGAAVILFGRHGARAG